MRLFKTIVTSLLILVASFGAGYGAVSLITGDKVDGTNASNKLDPKEILDVRQINVLLLGVDARPGEKDARTDTMIMASIDPKGKKVALLSIPRDTLVEIPGHGKQKINSANQYGGVEMAKEVVEKLVDEEIDYYVKTNFQGFPKIVDALGGVTIDVEKNMYYKDSWDGTLINLKKGVQKLNGKEALDYARFRHDALGDISRTQRQQKLLKEIVNQALKPGTVLKLPKLIPAVMDVVETDMSMSGMIELAKVAKNMTDTEIVTQTLPGQFYNNHGSYWKVDEVLAKGVLDRMLLGEKLELITGPDITVRDNSGKKSTAVAVDKNQTKPAETTKPTTGNQEDQQAEQAKPEGTEPTEPKETPSQPSTGTPTGEKPGTTQPEQQQPASTPVQQPEPTQPQPTQPQPGTPVPPPVEPQPTEPEPVV